ncbi:MAG: hypothetical protein JWR16_1432 [Nevskia sp.]|nr:hypothetical protein [Nevskia sp.]
MKRPIAYKFHDSDKADAEAWFLLQSNLDAAHKSIIEVIEINKHLDFKSVRPPDDLSVIHIEALFVYAVTMYLRSFATGKRLRLRIEEVPRISKTDLNTHENIRGLRNKHFAHAVSDEHEGAHIYLIVGRETKQKLGFDCYTSHLVCEGMPELRRFERLVLKVLKHVQIMGRLSADKLSRKFFGPAAKWTSCQYRLPLPKNRPTS